MIMDVKKKSISAVKQQSRHRERPTKKKTDVTNNSQNLGSGYLENTFLVQELEGIRQVLEQENRNSNKILTTFFSNSQRFVTCPSQKAKTEKMERLTSKLISTTRKNMKAQEKINTTDTMKNFRTSYSGA